MNERKRQHNKKWRDSHKEQIKEAAKIYYQRNKEKINERCRNWYAKNRPVLLDKQRAREAVKRSSKYYKEKYYANKENGNRSAIEWQKSNREKYRAYQRNYQKNVYLKDPENKKNHSIRRALCDALFGKHMKTVRKIMNLDYTKHDAHKWFAEILKRPDSASIVERTVSHIVPIFAFHKCGITNTNIIHDLLNLDVEELAVNQKKSIYITDASIVVAELLATKYQLFNFYESICRLKKEQDEWLALGNKNGI